MSAKQMMHLKLITAILPKGRGFHVLQVLHSQHMATANVHHARGSYLGGPVDSRGELVEAEQEILTCIVPQEDSEKIFNTIYEEAHFDQPQTGFMFMETLGYGTNYSLPKLN